MLNAVREAVRDLLARDGVIGVLGLSRDGDTVAPRVFTTPDQLDDLLLEPKWPLAKTAWRMASALPAGAGLGLVCRGCDARALAELKKAGQLASGAVTIIAQDCSAEQARTCLCAEPCHPGQAPAQGVDFLSDPGMRALTREPNRLELWREHFLRCIKCYGCRNSCPICVCPSCKLEQDDYVTLGGLPPDPFAFHLIRAMHLADRCVGCGACQEACPSGLPLLALHLALRRSLRETYGYASGGPDASPVLAAGFREGNLGAPAPAWEDTAGNNPGGGHAS